MKHIFTAVCAGAAFVLFGACTISKAPENTRSITVTGTGSVKAEPDQAELVLSVNTYNWIAKNGATDNAVIMARVLDAVKAAGITEKDLKTTDYSISQENRWQDGRQITGRYIITNRLNVLVHDISKVSDILDAAVAAGANEVTSISFEIADSAGAARQARTLAVQQAQDSASLLAGAGGCKLGKVLSIIEESGSQPRIANALLKSAGGDAATPINAGKVEVSSTVTVTYALQ